MKRVVLLTLALAGCIENGFSTRTQNSIAVTYGDFDDLTESLDRLLVQHGIYEGLISNATWTDDDIGGIPVEALFLEGEMRLHDMVFVASGTRGLGKTVYNANLPDDALVADDDTLRISQTYVRSNRSMLMTDWAYDLAEQSWPDQVDWLGEDGDLDAAQRGNIGTVVARVTDDRLAEALDMDQVVIDYNFSNWAVIDDVSDDTTVWLRGDVEYWDGDGWAVKEDAPLLVSFEPYGGDGRVVVMTFHANAQTPAVTDTLLETLLGPLPTVKE
ncbi:MAG: hypothetical protein H6737_19270 [Alphaproteobacteria bacterium]|nr:hypothetical protein [Alphaproteobacteria bacterium]